MSMFNCFSATTTFNITDFRKYKDSAVFRSPVLCFVLQMFCLYVMFFEDLLVPLLFNDEKHILNILCI